MERTTNAALFGKDAPKQVANPEYMDAAGMMTPMRAGEVVTPRKLVRQILTETLHRLGGVDWLVDFVKRDDANARVFFQGITKLLPVELSGPGGAPLTIVVRHEDSLMEGALIEGKFVPNPDAGSEHHESEVT